MSESKNSSIFPGNSIGTSLNRNPESTVYQNNNNVKASLEMVSYVNNIPITLNNAAWGTRSTVNVPRAYQLLGKCVLKVDVTYTGDVRIPNNYHLYNAIQELAFRVGSTERLRILGGPHLVAYVLNQARTEEQKRKVLEYAGSKIIEETNLGTTISYSVLLPLPWSDLYPKRKIGEFSHPLPLHMLSEPIIIDIAFKPKTQLYTKTEIANASNIVNAEFQFEYGKFASPLQMKKTAYKYNFAHPFCHTFPVSNVTGTQSIDIRSFRKGELKYIQLMFVKTGDLDSVPFTMAGEKMPNLELLFNGEKIYETPGTDDIWDLLHSGQPSQFGKSKIAFTPTNAHRVHKGTAVTLNTDALAGFVVGELDSQASPVNYYYNIPIAEILSNLQYSPGADFSKQSVQVRWTQNGGAGTLYCNYVYNAMYQFDGSSAILVL